MLESDARSKWCPEYRTDKEGDNRWTEHGRFIRESFCIGSKCAQWADDGYDILAKERTGHCGRINK